MSHHTAYICLGSNIGDKVRNCEKGINILTKNGDNDLLDQSQYYKTDPMHVEDQDWFINLVIKIGTKLDPEDLLKMLKGIEKEVGREADSIRFGPRILDMDILFYDDLVITVPGLKIPHPRMHQRRFVLQPLCDIDPDIVHPELNRDAQYLLENINDKKQKVAVYPC